MALKFGIRDRNFLLLPLSSLAPTVSEPLSVNTFGEKAKMFQNESRREKERGKRKEGRGKRADE